MTPFEAFDTYLRPWPAYFGFLACLQLCRSACYECVTNVVTNED